MPVTVCSINKNLSQLYRTIIRQLPYSIILFFSIYGCKDSKNTGEVTFAGIDSAQILPPKIDTADDLLPIRGPVPMNREIYFLRSKDTLLLDNVISLLPVEDPFYIRAFTPKKNITDTIIIALTYPTSTRKLKDNIPSLLQFCEKRIKLLSKLRAPSKTKLLAWFSFFDQAKRGSGKKFNMLWDIKDQYQLDYSEALGEPSPFTAEFEQKLENLDLAPNEILHFADSILLLGHFVRDPEKYRGKGYKMEESREAIRIIHELLGNDIHKYRAMREDFLGPKYQAVSYPIIDFKNFGFDKNSKAQLACYLALFPNRKKKCLVCD